MKNRQIGKTNRAQIKNKFLIYTFIYNQNAALEFALYLQIPNRLHYTDHSVKKGREFFLEVHISTRLVNRPSESITAISELRVHALGASVLFIGGQSEHRITYCTPSTLPCSLACETSLEIARQTD